VQHREKYVRIGEAARLIDVCVNTIRNFERRGLITVARSWSGVRRFGAKDLAALRALVALSPSQRRRKARRA
jgi:DNA-binding transcriptional MerR regulator